MQVSSIPQHVAIIMDGNRRWAKAHGLSAVAGHKKVVEERVEELIEHAATLGISHLTFWCFSTENWAREQKEVGGIMRLFKWALMHKAQQLIKKGARVKMIGDLSKFPQDIQKGFEKLIHDSEHNTKITVVFALNYGGRDEMIRAIKRMGEKPQEVTEDNFGQYLDTNGMPDPDLIIRTGGEQRLSGFLLWQSEYAELCFPTDYMPDFGAAQLDEALKEYDKRERRRGR